MVLLKLLVQLFEHLPFGDRHLAAVLFHAIAADAKQFEGHTVQGFLEEQIRSHARES